MQEGSYRTGEALQGAVTCLSSLPPPPGRYKVICSSSNQLARTYNNFNVKIFIPRNFLKLETEADTLVYTRGL